MDAFGEMDALTGAADALGTGAEVGGSRFLRYVKKSIQFVIQKG